MKLIATILLIAISLGACATKHETAESKQPIFMKDGVSDRQMTNDLNDCASEAFQRSMETGNASDASLKGGPQKECMHAKGYDVFYN